MNKKLTRTLAGAMSLMFMGQVMIFGDGNAQGLLHADKLHLLKKRLREQRTKTSLPRNLKKQQKIWEKWIFLMLLKTKMKLLIMRRLQKMIFLFNPIII